MRLKGGIFGIVALLCVWAGPSVAQSPVVGAIVFECTIAADYTAEKCITVKTMDVERAVLIRLVQSIETDWKGLPSSVSVGDRRQFIICDGSFKARELVRQGFICGITMPELLPRLDRRPTREEVSAKLDSQLTIKLPDVKVEVKTFAKSHRILKLAPHRLQEYRGYVGTDILCHWLEDGSVDECLVLSEYPEGYGWGDHVSAITVNELRIIPVEGVPDDQRWVKFRYFWDSF